MVPSKNENADKIQKYVKQNELCSFSENQKPKHTQMQRLSAKQSINNATNGPSQQGTFQKLRVRDFIILIQEENIQKPQMIPMQYFYPPFAGYFPFAPYLQQLFHQFLLQRSNYHLEKEANKNLGHTQAEEQIQKDQIADSQKTCKEQPKKRDNSERKQQLKVEFKEKNKQNLKRKNTQITKEKKQKQQHQIDCRNANSNLLRMFFRRLDQILQVSPEIITRIITKNKMKISDSKFLEWFQINKAEYTNYIRLPCVKKLFICNRVNKSGKFHTKIMRILLSDFLRKEAHVFYLTSKKIKRTAMGHNYHCIRTILKEIINEQSDL